MREAKNHPARMLKCTLKFSDGQEVSGAILGTPISGKLHPIHYEGAVDLLHLQPKTATAEELRFLFRRIAAMASAMLVERHT